MDIAQEFEQRQRVELIARSWIKTPYHHHARIKGAGVDCAQLLIAVYSEAGLIEPFETGYYPPQFFLHSPEERFLNIVTTYAHEIEEKDAWVGDVVLYRFGLCYAHGGIIVNPGWPDAIVHARYMSNEVTLQRGDDAGLNRSARKPKFFSIW